MEKWKYGLPQADEEDVYHKTITPLFHNSAKASLRAQYSNIPMKIAE